MHKTLNELITERGGAKFDDERPYQVTFHDGTKRFVTGISPKDAAAKVCDARLVTKSEITAAAFDCLNAALAKK